MKTNPTKVLNELFTVVTYITDREGNKNFYHPWRVAILSWLFAKEHVSPQDLKTVFYAAMLHDIGGAGFPYHILHYLKRNDRLSKNVLLSHPLIGAQLVSNIPQMTEKAKLILDHHEWINGQGYPRAKTEEDIPPGAQIIRLADSIDIALQTDKVRNLADLRIRLLPKIDKEYSKKMFGDAFRKLRSKGFFQRIRKRHNIPALFEEIKEGVGFMRIQKNVDAIGTTLEVVAQIIDIKHTYTSGHSFRVSRYAMSIALAMNLSHDEVTLIKWAGLIHDVGKYSVSQRVLEKPSSLTPKEFLEVKKHARLTQEVMDMLPTLKEVGPIASCHHEYFDGSGYPRGLKGKEIPFGARILAVCDAFDAMTSNRPYRQPLTAADACNEIKKFSGKQFDPEIVKYALPLFKNLGL